MAEERIQRRLAAILAADVVGYSRLMEADEAATRARIRALHAELIDPRIAADGGRIFKTMGDGILVEFASAVDAVRNALAIQDAMRQQGAGQTDDQAITFRIGVNLGDVIVEGDDIHGDGVNVAARLEGLCEPGAVYISASVHDQVAGKLAAAFDDLGDQSVKNIARAIRVYRVRPEPEQTMTPDQTDAPPPLPDKPSIAVLPFENMSGDPEQEYFSDGITEDIITELSKISGLFVIARHSAFVYKGQAVNLKDVGRDLGVRYVLEGSVRKAGNRLRITAQLIDATRDHHMWAERYDRDLKDIFAVQEEVARQVADALAVALKPGEAEQLAHAPTDNLDAYDFYMRARMSFYPPTRANLLNARNAFGRVIEIDPEFAGGHAGTSISYSMAVRHGHCDQPDVDAAKALQLARTAVALDPNFARAHSALGLAYVVLGRYDEAIIAAQRAVDLQPGDTDSYFQLAQCYSSAGDGERSREAVLTALRLDPRYVAGPYFNAWGGPVSLPGATKRRSRPMNATPPTAGQSPCPC